jgi:drug/metabolite transporter (DMT)-like permease
MGWLNRRFFCFSAWMATHFLAYIAVAISIRYLSFYSRIVEIAAVRSAGSLIIAAFVVFKINADRPKPIEQGVQLHIQRSLIHLVGSLALIWSVANLPLGFTATVEFSGPLFAALIGIAISARYPGSTASVGLALIAFGSAYLLYTQGVSQDVRLLIPVGAVALLTITNLMLSRLAQDSDVFLIVFIMHGIQLPIYIAILVFNLDPAPAVQAPDIDTLGILSILAAAIALMVAGFVTQIALASASRYGSPLQLCAADTLRIPFLTVVGYVAFGELLKNSALLPGLIVIAGAVITSLPRGRTQSRSA